MKNSKKTKVTIKQGDSIIKTPEEAERLLKFIQILIEIDRRESITRQWNNKSVNNDRIF